MITEDQVEQQCLQWFQDSGWDTRFGPDIAHDGITPERANYREVILVQWLTQALIRKRPAKRLYTRGG
jgi:type I restriction enzyme R subunit